MIRCPDKTGEPVHTGWIYELDLWAVVELAPALSMRCAACGEWHHWKKEDAWLHKERKRPQGVKL